MLPDLSEAARIVGDNVGHFDVAVILGSGLGSAVSLAEEAITEFDYHSLPGFSPQMVPGHAGRLRCATVEGTRVLFFQGRYHLYQGLKARQVVAPVLLAHALGCTNLLITNASGAINPGFNTGDMVFVTDHINLTGDNPLTGLVPPPFIDLSDLYRRDRYSQFKEGLVPLGINLKQGVLASLPGPSYETPAEIKMLRGLGADLVSMSVVHEAIAAHFLKMKVTALSLVTNQASGVQNGPLSHEEVLEAGHASEQIFCRSVRHFIAFSGQAPNS